MAHSKTPEVKKNKKKKKTGWRSIYLPDHTLTEDCGRVSWFNLKEEKKKSLRQQEITAVHAASALFLCFTLLIVCMQRHCGDKVAQRLRRILANSVNGDCMNATGWVGVATHWSWR